MTMFMGYYRYMIMINIHQAKANLSKYLKRLEKGEVILICKRNVPIAELRPISRSTGRKRPIGFMKGEFSIPPSFFEPLPEEILGAFEGSSRKTTP